MRSFLIISSILAVSQASSSNETVEELEYVFSTVIVPSVINLGFFYPLFPQYLVDDAEFLPSNTGMQMQAAIHMAINEINNKNDGIADDILPGTRIKFAARINPPTFTATAIDIIDLETNVFGGQGIQVAIGGSADNLTQSMSSFLQDYDIPQIGYNGGSLMSHTDLYRNYLRIAPSNAYGAGFIANVLHTHFGWNRVVVFTGTRHYLQHLLYIIRLN